jgi:hypothetical protein
VVSEISSKLPQRKKGAHQGDEQARKFAFVNLAQLTLLTQHSG